MFFRWLGRAVRLGGMPGFRRYSMMPNKSYKRMVLMCKLCVPVVAVFVLLSLVSAMRGSEDGVGRGSHIQTQASPVITIVGHGFGHGIGLGQWGAYGYSRLGWNYIQILHHYYGAFDMTPINTPMVKVELTREPRAHFFDPSGIFVGKQFIQPGFGVWVYQNRVYVTQGCTRRSVRSFPYTSDVLIRSAVPTTEDSKTMLRFCGTRSPYRGSMSVEYRGDTPVIYNHVEMEKYLRSVVPGEMQADWADHQGFQALLAQAVCARNYATVVMNVEHRLTDNDGSQIYLGIRGEDPRSDKAVTMTRGKVMTLHGKVIFAEYSSSTGGKTMGGRFPVVLDAGDMVSPYHTWTRKISQRQILHKLGYSDIVSIRPTISGPHSRDGLVILKNSRNQSFTMTMEEFSRKLGLPSAWIEQNGPVKVITRP